jgi:hypothetical protein
MNQKQPKKDFKYACIVIPVAVTNGIIGGISSVITAYLFKPVWDKIVKILDWNKNEK